MEYSINTYRKILMFMLNQAQHPESGKLLGYNSGYILQTVNCIQIFNKIAGVEFPTLPEDFFMTPTLNWKISS